MRNFLPQILAVILIAQAFLFMAACGGRDRDRGTKNFGDNLQFEMREGLMGRNEMAKSADRLANQLNMEINHLLQKELQKALDRAGISATANCMNSSGFNLKYLDEDNENQSHIEAINEADGMMKALSEKDQGLDQVNLNKLQKLTPEINEGFIYKSVNHQAEYFPFIYKAHLDRACSFHSTNRNSFKNLELDIVSNTPIHLMVIYRQSVASWAGPDAINSVDAMSVDEKLKSNDNLIIQDLAFVGFKEGTVLDVTLKDTSGRASQLIHPTLVTLDLSDAKGLIVSAKSNKIVAFKSR